jgi:hypothetical protein
LRGVVARRRGVGPRSPVLAAVLFLVCSTLWPPRR